MPHADPFQDAELNEVVADIVIRFLEHDQYGSARKAIAALRRRVPGYAPAVYEKLFHAHLLLLKRTIEVARPSRLARISPLSSDYDSNELERVFDEIQQGIAEIYPERPASLDLDRYISWVHVWHHLK